jgi:diguanylate cyclase (GGDEF)-like protein
VVDQRDDLTQLLSRGAFDRALQEGVLETRHNSEPFSLVLGDIDHFKRVNDTSGHPVGDAVLCGVADRLTRVTGGKGRVFRYGGEEIAIILKNHSANEAIAVAERCRREIEAAPIAGVAISMSFGVACLPEHARDARELVAAADRALYDAKECGRNLVRLSGEPPPTRPGTREPERKAAKPGKLTDQQKTELRRRLLRHQAIECPNDGAFFDVHDMTAIGSIGRDFLIVCPECGLTEALQSGQGLV